MIGKLLKNRYRIIKKIGSGGMATVYKAEDTLLDRNVALKILRPQFTDDEDFINRFRKEAKAAARLTHPNVVNIFDVGMEDDHHYIVMEYIYGKTLKQLIVDNAPLPVEEAVGIAKEISESLQHAHKNNIIHRDIKPHNILITSEGRVKVTDFGIARAASETTVTHQTGTILGSAHYFSPEQARGGFTGEKSDIYSLGIVLYEMLTGEIPFTGDTPVAVAFKHLQEDPPLPSELNSNVPQSIEKITLKALEKKQANRYQNIDDLLKDLKLWQSRELVNNNGFNGNELNGSFNADEKVVSDDSPTIEIPVAAGTGSLSEPLKVGEENKIAARNINDNSKAEKKLNPNNKTQKPKDRKDSENSTQDTNPPPRKKRKKPWNKVLIRNSIIILLVVGTLAYGLNWGYNRVVDFFIVEEVKMPDIEGISLSQAQEILEEKGLSSTVSDEISHPEVETGYVVSQSPAPERVIRQSREVNLTISLGPEQKEVPDVLGMQRRQAMIKLEEKGFEVDFIEEYNSDKDQGEVFEQTPDPGYISEQGSAVELKISRGGEPEEMPDYIDRELENVDGEVESDLDLNIRNVYEREEGVEEGVILEQWPDPGEEVRPGDSVDFWVSKGLDMEEVGDEYNLEELKVEDLDQDTEIEIIIDDEMGERVVFEGIPDDETMTFEGVEAGFIKIKEYNDDGELIYEDVSNFP